MTGERIVVHNGSVAVVPLSFIEDKSADVDGSSVLIVWDDETDSISSVRSEMKQALETQAAHLERVQHPILFPCSKCGHFEPETVTTTPVAQYEPREKRSEPQDKITAPVYTRR